MKRILIAALAASLAVIAGAAFAQQKPLVVGVDGTFAWRRKDGKSEPVRLEADQAVLVGTLTTDASTRRRSAPGT